MMTVYIDFEALEWKVAKYLAIDRYTQAASKLFKIPPEEVTPEQRKKVEEITIRLSYGAPPDRIPK